MEFLWNMHCCLKKQNRCLSIHTLNYHEQIFQAPENNLLCSTILIASYQQRILTNLKLNRGTDMSQPCHYKNWHWFNLAVEFVFFAPNPLPVRHYDTPSCGEHIFLHWYEHYMTPFIAWQKIKEMELWTDYQNVTLYN